MLHGNILSGAPFRAAIFLVGIFIAILVMMGVVLYNLTESSLYHELEQQIREETILFNQVYNRGGQKALVGVLNQLERPVIAGERIAGLFDSQGNRLAGNVPTAPDFVGWKTLTLGVQAAADGGNFHLFTAKLETTTLVVGRSTGFIEAVMRQFLIDCALAGLVVVLSSLTIGYVLSRRMFFKLERLANILNEVSRGDMRARLPVEASNDQIDRVSRQINAHLDQLSTLMSSTRNTANAIAHDLRAPLNRTYLLLQEALAAQETGSETEVLIDRAGMEIREVSEIIDTILRIARIEGGADHPGFDVFSLSELVSELAEVFQPVIEGAGQRLSVDNDPSADALVNGDKKMLRQMLVNLIENAICHCPAGTSITLATGTTPQEGVFLSVADTGPGVEQELRQKVLEPFFRVDASRSSPGSGLGLALVKAIAVRHSATLSLEDNSPGLRVTIVFPPVETGSGKPA